MEEFDPNIAHISCPVCNKVWQIINEEGTDWDEQKTAEIYSYYTANCKICAQLV